jgi:hypothetical protein
VHAGEDSGFRVTSSSVRRPTGTRVGQMAGERDLGTLLASMEPERRPGRFVYVTVDQQPAGAAPVAVVHEDEGVTLVLAQEQADRLGLDYDFVAAMITLRVHSSLEAVGLTAAVSEALAAAGISCNMMAGYYHDHLFVPDDQGDRAIDVLHGLAGARR